MTIDRILEGWNSYRSANFKDGAPMSQLDLMRRAFFAGVLVARSEEGLEALDNAILEFEQYLEQLEKGVV